MYRKIIDIANSLEFVNDYNTNGITGNNARISTSQYGDLCLYSTQSSTNSSTASIVLYNGGLSINNTLDTISLTSGGSLTVRGGASFEKSIRVGESAYITNIISTNTSIENSITTSLTAGNIYFTGNLYQNGELFVGGGSSQWINDTDGSISFTSGAVNITDGIITNLTIGNYLISNINTNDVNLGISNIYSGSFTLNNNNTTPLNITGLSFDNNIRSFTVNISISIERTGGNLYETFVLDATKTDSQWILYTSSYGDNSGIVFSITNDGYIQYTSTAVSGFINSIARFYVNQIADIGNYVHITPPTQGTLLIDQMQILNTTDSEMGINSGSLYLAGGATISKSLYALNISSSNLNATNSSIGSFIADSGTITNINATTLTAGTLQNTNAVSTNVSAGTLALSTGLTSASAQITNLNATTLTSGTLQNTNAVSTNISSSTLALSTGLTSASAMVTNANVTTLTAGTLQNTNAVSTNISSSTLALSTGLTSASAMVTNANVTTLTAGTLQNTNAVSTNVSAGTLALSTGLTSASAQITNANITTLTTSTIILSKNTQGWNPGLNLRSPAAGNENFIFFTNHPTNTLPSQTWLLGTPSGATGGSFELRYSQIVPSLFICSTNGNIQIPGALSKGSGTFDIEHPLDSNKRLCHSFIEGPRCDLIYRGSVRLENGIANVNIDKECTANTSGSMSQGTFEALCANPIYYLQNDESFDRVRGSITGNILTIMCENTSSTDMIFWMVVAERKDPFIKAWDRTDTNGFLVPEYNKPE
jgi:hypothetical protein